MPEKNRLNVRVEMSDETLDRFKKIQALLGIENGTEVIRYLISEFYRKNLINIDVNAQTRKLTEPMKLFDGNISPAGIKALFG